MKKLNSFHEENNGCITSYTNCIRYNGVDIPCLGIKNGDWINHILCAIIDKICELSGPDDLSTISIQCLLNNFNNINEPLSPTIVTYLQLLIDNQCTIKQLIDAINTRINNITNTSLVLDLKCLTIPNSQGNTIYTVQTVLQSLITEICSHKLQLATINGILVNLQAQITAIIPYSEPLLTSCVYTNKPTSQALQLLATNYCNYKIKVGTETQIDLSLGRQCTGLNTLFAGNANFILNPQSLADTNNNQWMVICNLLNRVNILEACACKQTCDDIKIGFITEYNDGNLVTLKFTSGAGTFIPTGYIDCGSTLKIKNDKGITSNTINIVISQNGEIPNIDISMFEQGEYLTYNIEAKLCKEGMNCSKCISKISRNTSGCCLITNSGIGEVTIIYKTCGISVPIN